MLRFSDATLAQLRQRTFALTFVGSTLAAWFILSREVTQASLGLQLPVVTGFSAIYLVAQLVILLAPDAVAKSPRWAPLRVLCVMTLVAGGFIYAATSTLEFTPAWVFVIAIAHLGVRFEIHRYRALTLCFAAMGPLLHLALGPHVTWGSFAVSVVAGLTGMIVLLVLGRRVDETASLDADAQLDRRELDARQGLLARVAVAMAVHDRLSGLLVGVRLKVKRARAYADVADALSTVISRANGLLDDRVLPEGQLFDAVREAVEAQGATLDLRLEQRRPFSADEANDVRDIVSEACVNAAKSGPGAMVQLHLVVDAAGVSILCRGSGGCARTTGKGRGLRNMRLRSWARGGTFSFEAGDTCLLYTSRCV